MTTVAETFKKEIEDVKKELDNTRHALAEVNEELYEKTWQLKYAHHMLQRIMSREHPDEFSLNLLLRDLTGFMK